MTDYPLRLGQTWLSQDARESPLVTIVRVGRKPENERGHRPDDRLLGVLRREDAARLVTFVNGHLDFEGKADIVETFFMREAELTALSFLLMS